MKIRLMIIALSLALLATASTVAAQPTTGAILTNSPTLLSANTCTTTGIALSTEASHGSLVSLSNLSCGQCRNQWNQCVAGCNDFDCVVVCLQQYNSCRLAAPDCP